MKIKISQTRHYQIGVRKLCHGECELGIEHTEPIVRKNGSSSFRTEYLTVLLTGDQRAELARMLIGKVTE